MEGGGPGAEGEEGDEDDGSESVHYYKSVEYEKIRVNCFWFDCRGVSLATPSVKLKSFKEVRDERSFCQPAR